MDIYNNEYGFDIPEEHILTTEDTGRLKRGDVSIVNPLVEGTTNFVVQCVGWFIHETPKASPYREDLISHAMLVNLEFTHTCLGKDYNPDQFMKKLKSTVKQKCGDWVVDNSMAIKLPTRSRVVQRKLTEDICVTDLETLLGDCSFDDILATLSPLEQLVIRMKIVGKSKSEICQETNLNLGDVNSVITKVKVVFNEIC
jgi:hypothetical protein